MARNIVDNLVERFEGLLAVVLWRGTVVALAGDLVSVRRADQGAADVQPYPRLASYTAPVAGDEVFVVRVGRGYLVVGKILR